MRAIAAGFLIFFAIGAIAAPSTSLFDSRVWDTNDGLPHNSITAIAQTKDGFLWVGTPQGLARFDGIKFTTLDLSSAISNNPPAISALCAGNDGGLWVGTRSDGVIFCKNGKLTHYSTGTGLLNNSIRAMLLTQDSLWIGSLHGLTRLNLAENKFTQITNVVELNSVRCLHLDGEGTVWLVGGLGKSQVYQYKSNVLSRFVVAENVLQNSAARSIWVDRDGSLWLGFSSGVLKCDREHNELVFAKQDGLVDNVVSSFGEDKDGNFWIGTFGGLSRWFQGQFIREFNQTGVFFDQVNVISDDREGNLWLGTKAGLYQLSQTMSVSYAREHGLSHNNVMSICEMEPGTFCIGTWGGGLNWMEDGKISHYTQASHSGLGLTSDFILGIAKENDREFWFGTDYGGGVFKAHLQDDGALKFSHFGAREGLTNSVIRTVHVDSKDNYWLGTQEGAVSFDHGKFKNYPLSDSADGSNVRDIAEDFDGNHWFATAHGLRRLKDGQFKEITKANGLPDNDIRALYADKSLQLIWIATANNGLGKLKIKGEDNFQFTFYDAKAGLWSDEIFDLVDDEQGSLWMSCIKGVFRVAKDDFDDFDSGKTKKLRCITLENRGDGTSIQCNGVAKPSIIRASDGRLLFSTVKGVLVVDPTFNRTNPFPPSVVIERVIADKEEVMRDGWDAIGNHSRQHSAVVSIPPGRGELEFRYTALSFQEPERVRFKYKLEGVDEEWIDAGNERDARYNNIVPGDYTFRVIASNSDGVWNETGATVQFTLQPHFWQTWWFYFSGTLAAIGFVAGGARYATKRRLQIKLQRLEQQNTLEKERARIARDMHDEIGARLTQISFLGSLAKRRLHDPGEAGKQIDTISQTARELVSVLDEIVWTVDPRKDTLDNLATFLCRYASNFFQESSITCEFDLPADLPNVRLETDVRHNIFLAVKESLNNVMKHSGGDRVVLQMRVEGRRLEMVISDNGKGFDSQPMHDESFIKRAGNGLINIRQRIEGIGGKCRIENGPNKGTHLYFSLDLPKPENPAS